jgi:hypothetical protein
LWIGLWIAFFVLVACSIVVIVKHESDAQALPYPPSPVASYVNAGSGWTAWAAALGSQTLLYDPSPIALYCNSGSGWQPCNPVTGGSPYNPASVAITGGTISGVAITNSTVNGVSQTEEVVTPSATPAFSGSTASSIITLTASVTSYTIGSGLYNGQIKTITWCEGTGGFTVAGPPTTLRGAFNPFGTSTAASTCSSQAYEWHGTLPTPAWGALNTGYQNF